MAKMFFGNPFNKIDVDEFRENSLELLQDFSLVKSHNFHYEFQFAINRLIRSWEKVDFSSLSSGEARFCYNVVYEIVPNLVKDLDTKDGYFFERNPNLTSPPARLNSISKWLDKVIAKRMHSLDGSGVPDICVSGAASDYVQELINHSMDVGYMSLYKSLHRLKSAVMRVNFSVLSDANLVKANRMLQGVKREVVRCIGVKAGSSDSYYRSGLTLEAISFFKKFDSGKQVVEDVNFVVAVESLPVVHFVNPAADSVYRELCSAFDSVRSLNLSVEDSHFVEQVISSYVPNAIEAYSVIENVACVDDNSEGVSVDSFFKQLRLIISRLIDIRERVIKSAFEKLKNQENLIQEVSVL